MTQRARVCQVTLAAILLLIGRAASAQTLYTDTWNDDPNQAEELPIYAIGVNDDTYGGSYPQYVELALYGDEGQLLASDASGHDYLYAETSVDAELPFEEGKEVLVNCGESTHFEVIYDTPYEIGETSSQILPRGFRAVFAKSGYDSFIGKWRYVRESAYCAHKCQGTEFCLNDEYNFIYIPGWHVLGLCLAIPPWPRAAATRPVCKSAGFGSPLFTQTDCS